MNEKNYLDPELIPVRFMADDVIATSAWAGGTAGDMLPGDGSGNNGDIIEDD